MKSINLDDVVDEYLADHAKHTRGPAVDGQKARATFADVVARLRAMGVTLPVILSVVSKILAMIPGGATASAIIAAIMPFIPTPPTPAPAGS